MGSRDMSLEMHDDPDRAPEPSDALDQLLSLLKYVSGDYKDPGTFDALKKMLGEARRPAHYEKFDVPGRGRATH